MAETEVKQQSFTVLPTDELRVINVADIVDNPNALRGCNTQDLGYQELKESVKENFQAGGPGVLESILVRECEHEDGTKFYGLINGLQRTTACRELGIPTIAANVRSMSDSQVLYAQLITNVQRIETKPREYAIHLQRILAENPSLTQNQLARDISKTPAWIANMLGLTKLDPAVGALVDSGQIGLVKAYALSKMPTEMQNDADWIRSAIADETQVFVGAAEKAIKDARDAKRKGEEVKKRTFELVPVFLKRQDLLDEISNGSMGSAIIEQLGISDPLEAWKVALQYTLQIDPVTAELRENQYKAEQERAAEVRKRKDLERAEKKLMAKNVDAAEVAAEVERMRLEANGTPAPAE